MANWLPFVETEPWTEAEQGPFSVRERRFAKDAIIFMKFLGALGRKNSDVEVKGP